MSPRGLSTIPAGAREIAGRAAADSLQNRDEFAVVHRIAGVHPDGLVPSLGEVLADPQAPANGYVGRTMHPDVGEIGVAGLPILFERDPVAPPPARPGADTDAHLAEVGYSAEEIDRLRDEGVI